MAKDTKIRAVYDKYLDDLQSSIGDATKSMEDAREGLQASRRVYDGAQAQRNQLRAKRAAVMEDIAREFPDPDL